MSLRAQSSSQRMLQLSIDVLYMNALKGNKKDICVVSVSDVFTARRVDAYANTSLKPCSVMFTRSLFMFLAYLSANTRTPFRYWSLLSQENSSIRFVCFPKGRREVGQSRKGI